MNVEGQKFEPVTPPFADGLKSLDPDGISWTELCPGAYVKVLAVDEKNHCVDSLVKFEPNFIFNKHRHLAQACALVVEGEIRDVFSGEACNAGRWIVNPPGTVHQESSGPEGFVLLASLRGDSAELIEVLDDDGNVVQEVTVADYKAIYDNQ